MKKIKLGFTLVELMVVITIIAVLAGFSVPAISGALDRSNQTKDLNNIKQLAHVLFMDANDHQGAFRASDGTNNATDIFKKLLEEKVLSSTDVLSGFNVAKYEEATLDKFASSNVAWSYFAGLTTGDDDKLPLLMSKGNTNITTADLTGTMKLVDLSGSPAWGKKGIVIAYKGQNVEFKKADKDGKILLGAGAATINTNAALLQP